MVNLKETKIQDLENFDWVAYFEYNCTSNSKRHYANNLTSGMDKI